MKATLKTTVPVPGIYPGRISGYNARFADVNMNLFELISEQGIRGINCECMVKVTYDPFTGHEFEIIMGKKNE